MKTLKFDVMWDSPFKVLLGVVVPLLLVYGISVFTTSVTNEIYSRTIGPDAFTVTSLISTLLSVMQSIVGSISVAAWIRTASTFQQDDRQTAERSMVSAVYAIIFVSAAVSGVLLLLTNPLLKALHIPAEIYSSVRQYYLIYIGSYFLCAIAESDGRCLWSNHCAKLYLYRNFFQFLYRCFLTLAVRLLPIVQNTPVRHCNARSIHLQDQIGNLFPEPGPPADKNAAICDIHCVQPTAVFCHFYSRASPE